METYLTNKEEAQIHEGFGLNILPISTLNDVNWLWWVCVCHRADRNVIERRKLISRHPQCIFKSYPCVVTRVQTWSGIESPGDIWNYLSKSPTKELSWFHVPTKDSNVLKIRPFLSENSPNQSDEPVSQNSRLWQRVTNERALQHPRHDTVMTT